MRECGVGERRLERRRARWQPRAWLQAARRTRARGEQDERGAALVMVLVFGVGLVTSALLLLTLAEQSVRVQASRERDKALHAILRTGVADVVFEVNAYYRALARGEAPAPDPDGVGARGVDAPIQVRDSTGRLVGEYVATFDTTADPDRPRLTVLAAAPSFARPEQRAGARHEVSVLTVLLPPTSGLGGDREPFQLNGQDLAWKPSNLGLAANARLRVQDLAYQQAAGRIGDPDLRGAIVDKLMTKPKGKGVASWIGADPANPGGSAMGADTVINADPVLLTQEDLDAMLGAFDTYVNGLIASAATTVTQKFHAGSFTLGGPGQVVVAGPGFMVDNNSVVSGQGTLVIPPGVDLVVDSNATLNWDGDIVVWGDGAAVDLNSNGVLNLSGNLVVDGRGATTDFRINSNAAANITGSMLLLSNTDEADFIFDSNGELNIDGIFLAYGKGLDLEFDSNARTTINGSAMLNLVGGSSLERLWFNSKSETTFNFDGPAFDAALAGIVALYERAQAPLPGPPPPPPFTQIAVRTYVEGVPATLEQQQAADVAQPDGPGFPLSRWEQ